MLSVFTIFLKEVKDNLRDKRSLFFGLVYGPLLMPALMIGPIIFTVEKHAQYRDSGREFHVYQSQRAPNLIAYLKSKNLDAVETKDSFQQKIKDGEIKLVLEISENYADKLLLGAPAKITLHYDKQDSESQSLYWQIRGELNGYRQQIASQRMAIRGFDSNLLRALDIADNDLSEEELGAGTLANIIMFLVVFSTMMGGFYLAVDIFAGERERISLEPLLSLPLSRTQVVLGKLLAIALFCSVSCILPIISAGIWSAFIPSPFFGDADIPGLVTFAKILLISLPLSILMASFLVAIASYSKSVKEAQTQLGVAMILPMAPFFVVQFLDVKTSLWTSITPILSQYMLVDKIMMNSAHSIAGIVPSILSILVISALLFWFSVYQYRQDRILS